jgi:hypothetical protein
MHERAFRLLGEGPSQPLVGDAVLVLDEVREQRLVVLGQDGERVFPERAVHRHDGRRQPLADRFEHSVRVGAAAIGLVHEEQRRDAEPLQRPHQQRRLRLNAFDGRDHEHRAVEHVEHAFHLRDEVRVPRRVDQVDDHVVDLEGHDRGLDRDAPLLLERQRVGLRRALVDAAELANHAGLEEQAFRESCLTGVYMRQDPQVERSSKQASFPPNRSQRPPRLAMTLCAFVAPGRIGAVGESKAEAVS